jgi:hypothetical protein
MPSSLFDVVTSAARCTAMADASHFEGFPKLSVFQPAQTEY